MQFQATEVSKSFGFVFEFANVGNKVVFQWQGSCIEAPDGNRTKLTRFRGMSYLDCWGAPRPAIDDPGKFRVLVQEQGR